MRIWQHVQYGYNHVTMQHHKQCDKWKQTRRHPATTFVIWLTTIVNCDSSAYDHLQNWVSCTHEVKINAMSHVWHWNITPSPSPNQSPGHISQLRCNQTGTLRNSLLVIFSNCCKKITKKTVLINFCAIYFHTHRNLEVKNNSYQLHTTLGNFFTWHSDIIKSCDRPSCFFGEFCKLYDKTNEAGALVHRTVIITALGDDIKFTQALLWYFHTMPNNFQCLHLNPASFV